MAATDPVEQRHQEFVDSPDAAFRLGSRLKRLAALEPATDVPYLTVTMDLRAEGGSPGRRPGVVSFKQQRDEVEAQFPAHAPARESLTADLDRIEQALAEIDPAARGVKFVARSAGGVFEQVLLGVPLGNRVVLAPTPALLDLARAADDWPLYAVVVADQQEAHLTLVARDQPQFEASVSGDDFPAKQKQGGWSQKRNQNRADERIEGFAKSVAEETSRVLRDMGIDILILAGEERFTQLVQSEFDDPTQTALVGTVRLPVDSGVSDLLDAANPVVERAERRREQEAVDALREGAGPGGGAVVGVEDTLTALQAQQVMILVMNADFASDGWADYTFPIYGVGDPPSTHPAGGDVAAIVPVDLAQEMVRLALTTADRLEFVDPATPVDAEALDAPAAEARSEAARALDGFGGVGAIVRFVLADDRSTATM